MQLTFLSGKVPLTKTITYNNRDGQYTTTPYPLVKNVTSADEAVTTLADFERALKKHAALGACLLKGGLDRPLTDESRAGHSVDDDHHWIVFDFDKVDCPPTFDGALVAIGKYLPRECQGVECIVQLSASCAHPEVSKLSCHIYMLLDEPVPTRTLTDYFTWINYNTKLKDELLLSDSGVALHWPLDRTTAPTSRLIYIAPPRTVGFEPTLTQTIQRYTGKTKKLRIPHFTPVDAATIRDTVNQLRRKHELPELEARVVQHRGQEMLVGMKEDVQIHDLRNSGNGFLRFNLNGGDSLAYFINLRDPGVIGNFKGEPFLYTKEVAPKFLEQLTKSRAGAKFIETPTELDVMAFYATNRGSAIYIGSYDRVADRMIINTSNETAARSWLAQHGVFLRGPLPHYDLSFDVRSTIRYEEGYPVINMYRTTDFIKEFADAERTLPCDSTSLEALGKAAPTLYRTIRSACGDEPSTLAFINWLARIFQTREKSMTTWIMHGVQGTGKGMLFNNIIRPLFGEDTCTMVTAEFIESSFNSFLDGKLFVAIDELDMSRSVDAQAVIAKIKNWTTEPKLSINQKMQVEREVESFVNMLVFSNSPRPLIIDNNDRRFHVGEYQTERLYFTAHEVATLRQGTELPSFAECLGSWMVDEEMALYPTMTAAKARMVESTHSTIDKVGQAILTGDSNYFFEMRPSELQLRTDFGGKVLPIREYDALLRAMANNTLNVLTPADLYTLFKMVVLNDKQWPEQPAAQRRILVRFNLVADGSSRCKRQNKSVYGKKMAVEWQPVTEENLALLPQERSEDKVASITSRKKK